MKKNYHSCIDYSRAYKLGDSFLYDSLSGTGYSLPDYLAG